MELSLKNSGVFSLRFWICERFRRRDSNVGRVFSGALGVTTFSFRQLANNRGDLSVFRGFGIC